MKNFDFFRRLRGSWAAKSGNDLFAVRAESSLSGSFLHVAGQPRNSIDQPRLRILRRSARSIRRRTLRSLQRMHFRFFTSQLIFLISERFRLAAVVGFGVGPHFVHARRHFARTAIAGPDSSSAAASGGNTGSGHHRGPFVGGPGQGSHW